MSSVSAVGVSRFESQKTSTSMNLTCLTYSHQHVPIELREQIYFDSNSIEIASDRIRLKQPNSSGIVEFVILSTCHRTEIYTFSDGLPNDRLPKNGLPCEIRDEVVSWVTQSCDVNRQELLRRGKWIEGPEVLNHLARVACGLESLVIGEPQILGQVGDAMRLAESLDSSGPVLTKMFQAAIRAGRRARAETQINKHSLNLSTAAVDIAERRLGTLSGKMVVVLGTGEMADLAIKQLRKKGATNINVVSRTLAKAKQLASKHNGQAFVFEQINSLLSDADVLISSTSAPHPLITRDRVGNAMQDRENRPLIILDIAVPRDVEPSVEKVPRVQRFDVDDLHLAMGNSARLRHQEIPRVEDLIHQEIDRFLHWFRSIGIESTITGLRQKTDDIRTSELNRLYDLLPDLSEESRDIIKKFADSLVNKILHDPTVQLRQHGGTHNAVDHGEAIRQLFRLPSQTDPASCEGSY